MRTAARNVAQQAADDLQSGHSRESNTVSDDDMDVLALDVNEEPEDKYDEELLDGLVAVGKALEIKNMIDMEVFETEKVIDGWCVLRREGARNSDSQMCGQRDGENLRCGQRVLCRHSTDLVFQMST